MSRRVAAALLSLTAGFWTASAEADGLSKDPQQAPAGAYRLETSHSQVLFAIAHIGLTNYYGRFNKVSGTLSFDPKTPENSSVSITIDMASVDTPSAGVVRELVGNQVFDVKTFPVATFKSTSITRTGPDTGKITGDLKLRGISQSVTLDVVFNGTEPNPIGSSQVLGFHATATLKRTDFGIEDMVWEPLVSDDVTLTIEALFQQEPK